MAIEQRGKITTWKDDKGFGFITPDDGSREVFFHISSVTHNQSRPTEHTAVTYTVTYDQQQRPRATNVYVTQSRNNVVAPTLAVVGLFFLVLALATYVVPLPIWVLIDYAVVSIITFLAYGTDKTSALQGARRTPENTLHLLELLGGWPGSLAAQACYRHKTKKPSYQAVYWGIVVCNLAALVFFSVVARTTL